MRALTAVVAVAVLGTLGVATAAPQEAEAVTAADWRAGNIISDELFYDSQAMTVGEIQGFLDSMIGSCNNGRCLNVLTANVNSRPAVSSTSTGNLICKAFTGGTLSAAEIIYRAQVACSISAKVILVTLQKEQSLTGSKAPTTYALDRAMGMACPDTAPCAPAYLGFGNQVYEGARQLMAYKAANFARQPGYQSIQYNPSTSCGAGSVYVENYATAALYNYTPYQPNAAALANLGSYGDGCSSYGNRNFWVYYNDWFGSTAGSVASQNRGSYLLAINTAGALWFYPGNGRGGWSVPKQIGQGWTGFTQVFGAGDFDGDGNRDVLAVDPSGTLTLFPSDGQLGWGQSRAISSGWSSFTTVFTPGDFTGDRTPDVMAVDAVGDLWLWANNGYGKLGQPTRIGWGWGGMTALFGAGDFDGDGKADLLARTATGALILYRGNGGGGWAGSGQIGNGWNIFDSIVNPGDFNGDGFADVIGRDTNGLVRLYLGNGRGGWLAGSGAQIGMGWGGFTKLIGPGPAAGRRFVTQPGVGDVGMDGGRDVLTRDASGAMYLYRGNGAGGWAGGIGTRVAGDWSGYGQFFGADDFNGDGVRDFMGVDGAGNLILHSQTGPAAIGGGTQIGNGWGVLTFVQSVGDFDGDRKPDLIGRDANGFLLLHRGDGNGGWLGSRVIGNGWQSLDLIVSAGDVNSDGTQDVIGRTPNGDLWLYPGDGTGGWREASQIGSGWAGMTTVFSPGDFTGDGFPDLVARAANGDLWLYAGNGSGAYLGGSRIGNGWQGFSWIG